VILVSPGLVAAALALFSLIAQDLLRGGGLVSHAEAVLTWFVDHRTDWMISTARFVSTIGGFVSRTCLSLVFAIWVRRRRWPLGLAVAPSA
jgi:hypothetical protein